MSLATTRTTLNIPTKLLEAADFFVQKGLARSRNDLVTTALMHELKLIERVGIDSQFTYMAEDIEYQAEVQKIMNEFTRADLETLQTDESQNI